MTGYCHFSFENVPIIATFGTFTEETTMKGISEKAQKTLDTLQGMFMLRECDMLSAIIEGLPLDHMASLIRTSVQPDAPKLRPSKYARRIDTASMKVRQSKYGFADMQPGVRYTIECDIHTSTDYPIQAAKRFAQRMNYDYWYQRVKGARAVMVCFYTKSKD